jgi:RNA polymerase sigma-70 factor (ECF subfamily)
VTDLTEEEFAGCVVGMRKTLYRVCYGLLRREADREDAVSECVRKALLKRETLRDERAFRAWMIRILVNECHSIQRRAARETLVDEVPERAAPNDPAAALREAILSLPEKLRLPVILHYMDGYPLSDVARALHVPEGTVKSRLARARERLKDVLSDEEA